MKKLNKIIAIISIACVFLTPFSVFADTYQENSNSDNKSPIIVLTNNKTKETIIINDYNISTEYKHGIQKQTITADINLDSPKTRASITDAGATVRITFVVSAQNSGSNYRMSGFKAKYTVLDKAFSISSRHIKVANFGGSDILNSSKYIYDYNPTTNSYSKSFSNLKWVNSNEPGLVGGYAECNISRTSSSWNLKCYDWVVYNDACPF